MASDKVERVVLLRLSRLAIPEVRALNDPTAVEKEAADKCVEEIARVRVAAWSMLGG